MSFVLYTLLPKELPESMSADALAAKLDKVFRNSEGFSWKFESMPFTNKKSVRLQWDGWSVNLTYGGGDEVKDDSKEIHKRLGANAPAEIANIDRRIHVFFANDDDQAYTNQAIYVMQFLEGLEGAIVFDPQQNKILNPA